MPLPLKGDARWPEPKLRRSRPLPKQENLLTSQVTHLLFEPDPDDSAVAV